MGRQYVNLIDAAAAVPHDRWRVTWYNGYDWRDAALGLASFGLADTSASAHAKAAFETLPSSGVAYAISAPVADDSASVFVMDVQLMLQLAPGLTVADVADEIERAVPGCTVTRVEEMSAGESSAEADQARSDTLAQAAATANAETVTQKVSDAVGSVATTVEHSFMWLALALAAGVAVYLLATRKK